MNRATPPSLHDSLRQLLAESVTASHGRLELLIFELGDERERLGLLLKRGLVVALACFVALQFAVLLVVALVWNSDWRIAAISALLAAALIAAMLALRWLHATPDSALFDISRREFARDGQGINPA